MKKVSFSIVLLLGLTSLQLRAQTLSPQETKLLADKSMELYKTGSVQMLEFMSSGDTALYYGAISSWRESKAGYQRVLKDGTADKSIAGITGSLYDIELSVVDTYLMIYNNDGYMKNKIASETEKDRTKKIKAGGKEYKVSKYSHTFASSLAKGLK